ncbi:FimV/HubP family polar landmark protein [Snodgrassella sp. CFCC 13594]|uniref:FimV/HubP family polar landmark protein n=1 Tax=Snodgrassella sp. CFCC 13594 TaxID=1775559 RepID=UPI000A6EAB03|nr:FimV/HubP family polar landmark protein [Snodgrassella sp. CFCC 13594]
MNNRHQLKIIAISLCTMLAGSAWGALGGLQVKSALGEPFSGTIVVSGDEAKVLLKQGKPNISGASLQAQVVAQGDGAVIRLHSSQPIRDPLLTFNVSVGHQGRQYTALLDPPSYQSDRVASHANVTRPTQKHPAKPAESRKKTGGPAQTAKKNTAPTQSATPIGKRYRVENNEYLIDVARKIQPHGLSLAQTMRALINANPHAFRNGNPDLMYRNAILDIPSAERLRELAKGASSVRPAAKTSVEPVAKGTAAPNPDINAAASAADATSVPTAASATVSASVPTASAASVAPKPAAKATPQPMPLPVEETGLFDGWLQWALLGGLGILLLLALLLYRHKRQQGDGVDANEPEPIEPESPSSSADDHLDDEDVVFMDVDGKESAVPEIPNPAAPASLLKPSVVAATTAAVVADRASAAEVPATNQPKMETAEANRDDWDWLNDDATKEIEQSPLTATAVQTPSPTTAAENAIGASSAASDEEWLKFDVLDEVPEVSTQPQSMSPAPTTAATPAGQHAADEDLADMDWLTQDAEMDATSPLPTVVPTEIPDVTSSVNVEDKADDGVLEWSVTDADADVAATTRIIDAPVVPAAKPTAAEAPAISVVTDHQHDLAETFTAPASADDAPDDQPLEREDSPLVNALQPQHQQAFAATGDALVADDIDWGALGLVDETTESEAVIQNAKGAVQETEEHGTHEGLNATSLSLSSDDHPSQQPSDVDFNADLEMTGITTAPALDVAGVEGMADEHVEPAAATPDQTSVIVPPNVANEAETQPAAVVNDEAVNLTVPMEAKLELAKMYLEIDDAATARKTLHELVDEANGEVLAEAQSLLQQLGG